MLTQERLKELLTYDPLTGIFRWINDSGRYGRIKAGTKAGSNGNGSQGYIEIGLDGKKYKAHRLAILYVEGNWPPDEVDHMDGVRVNNRYSNLRKATFLQNRSNLKRYETNTSGFAGVSFHKRVGKWQARISSGAKRMHLGYFPSPEEASEAYKEAKAKHHAFTPKHREMLT
jgi:hypothetical protein